MTFGNHIVYENPCMDSHGDRGNQSKHAGCTVELYASYAIDALRTSAHPTAFALNFVSISNGVTYGETSAN